MMHCGYRRKTLRYLITRKTCETGIRIFGLIGNALFGFCITRNMMGEVCVCLYNFFGVGFERFHLVL